MTSSNPVDEALTAVDNARADVDRLTETGASTEQVREAERVLRHAKRRLMFARAGALERSEHLEDTGAPPGSHEHKPPRT